MPNGDRDAPLAIVAHVIVGLLHIPGRRSSLTLTFCFDLNEQLVRRS